MTSKQVRWRCPSCSSGVLAPSRPRKLDVRRWCLDCSAKGPRLVERVPVALEAKRKERKKRQARKAAAKRGFLRPNSYYCLVGHMDIRRRLSLIPDAAVRARVTKGPGPVLIRKDDKNTATVTFRKGPWADAFDVQAQALVADARWGEEVIQGMVLNPKLKQSRATKLAKLRGRIKERVEAKTPQTAHPLAGWRPRSLAKLEIELADLLRKNAAVKLLMESSDLTERATG